MNTKSSFWQRIGMHEWFLKKDAAPLANAAQVTPNDVYKYIVEQFRHSITQLSFANRVVFYHEYIIAFNTEDYHDFIENKKGIFGLIVHESVKQFYEILKEYRSKGKTVEPSSSKWVFRFVSHPDYERGDKSFIGKLLPGSSQKQSENLRITYIPRQTGIAETADISTEILKNFTFYSEGYYEVPYEATLVYSEMKTQAATGTAFARIEAIVPGKEFAGKKLEFLMKDDEITISGNEETKQDGSVFRLPTDWVNAPHLRIRFNKNEGRLSVIALGEKTIVNEVELPPANPQQPVWTELPYNSKLVLNGIVGINVFKA